MTTFGDTAEIDLLTGGVVRLPTPEADVRLVFGGRGLNILRLMREGTAKVDALSPDNPLLISLGLLTGTEAPSASRVYISARSPLTGVLGGSSIGGTIGHALPWVPQLVTSSSPRSPCSTGTNAGSGADRACIYAGRVLSGLRRLRAPGSAAGCGAARRA